MTRTCGARRAALCALALIALAGCGTQSSASAPPTAPSTAEPTVATSVAPPTGSVTAMDGNPLPPTTITPDYFLSTRLLAYEQHVQADWGDQPRVPPSETILRIGMSVCSAMKANVSSDAVQQPLQAMYGGHGGALLQADAPQYLCPEFAHQ